MAEHITITHTCDIDGAALDGAALNGGPGHVARQLGLDGRDYELDLCVPHNLELAQMIHPYIEAARKVQPRARRTMAQRQHAAEVRAWAKQQPRFAHLIRDRGRTPIEAVKAFEAAHR